MTEEVIAGFSLIIFLIMGAIGLFYYIAAGIYIVKDAPKQDQNVGVWALVHFLGSFFIGTWALGIYQIVTKRIGWGVFWLAFPFILSTVIFIVFAALGAALV